MKNRKCVLFEGAGSVGFLRKKRDFGFLFRLIAVLAVVAIAVTVIIGSMINGKNRNSGSNNMPNSIVSGTNEELSTGSESEIESEKPENTESEKNESEGGEVDDVLDGVVSLDLSKSELGACFVYNYTDMLVDFEGLLSEPFRGAKYSFTEEPLVMIVHTFSSQGYSDFDEKDPLSVAERGSVAVGEYLSERLNLVGVSTVHVTVVHDGADSDPYIETKKTIDTMLEIYPSVEYVIDLGIFEARDENERQIRSDSGSGCAQVRLTVSTEGKRWKDDVALALKMRRALNGSGKKLCLPVTVSESCYNSGSSLYYLKADVGTGANSSHEAFYAAEYFAAAFKSVIKK